MLDATIKAQLKAYLERLVTPIVLVTTLDDSAASQELRELVVEVAELSDRISVREDNNAALRKPSFAVNRVGGGDSGQKEFQTTKDTLGKNKLWAALPFVADVHIVPDEMEMTYGSPSAAMAFLDVVQKSFTS